MSSDVLMTPAWLRPSLVGMDETTRCDRGYAVLHSELRRENAAISETT
jgi:hypothetical protein